MSRSKHFTRRGFLVAGAALGVAGLAPGKAYGALPSSLHVKAIDHWVKAEMIGALRHVHFHCTRNFDLRTAVITVEHLASSLTLEKVSALGDWKFSDAPENVLASLYYKEGLRATFSSVAPPLDSIGTVLGDDGSILLKKERLDLLHVDGSRVSAVAVSPSLLKGDSPAYTMILSALRDGKTVFTAK